VRELGEWLFRSHGPGKEGAAGPVQVVSRQQDLEAAATITIYGVRKSRCMAKNSLGSGIVPGA
jgi:hypothetical protein